MGSFKSTLRGWITLQDKIREKTEVANIRQLEDQIAELEFDRSGQLSRGSQPPNVALIEQ